MVLLSPHGVCIIGPSVKAGLLSASPRRLLDFSIDLGYRCLFPHLMETGCLRHLLNQKCGHVSFFSSCCFFNNKLHSLLHVSGLPSGVDPAARNICHSATNQIVESSGGARAAQAGVDPSWTFEES